MGLGGFVWMQLVLGGGLAAAFAHAPLLAFVALALVAPGVAPFGVADWTLLITGYVTASLAALFAAAIERDRRLALSAITMPLYWPLASIAGVLAAFELLFRPHYWAKTEHGLTPRRPLPD